MLGERCEMSGRLADTNFIYVFLYHDGDQHTVSLEPTYYGELGAHLLLFFSVDTRLRNPGLLCVTLLQHNHIQS